MSDQEWRFYEREHPMISLLLARLNECVTVLDSDLLAEAYQSHRKLQTD